MKKWFIVGLIFVLHLGIANNVLSYTVIDYGPSEYLDGSPEKLAAMEKNLGISGLVIEDFCCHHVPGLTITGPTYGGTNYWPNSWGSPYSIAFIAWPTPTNFATIEITPGADMVGIGFGYMEYYSYVHSIMTINNDEVIEFTSENFHNFTFGILQRNGYITITRDEGDPPITSIIFKTSDSYGDAYSFDYIAIKFLEEDTDGDGIPDDVDVCPDTDLRPTVVIEGCNSGVSNPLSSDGCTISDKIAELASDPANHGHFTSAVAHYTDDLKNDGLITGQEKGAIQSCAGQSDMR
jgi:hypothetical protein